MPILFVYGTLRDADVQRAVFARVVPGQPDELVGFRRDAVVVRDPAFVAEGAEETHAVVRFTGLSADRVGGTALEITDAELARADAYEPREYRRVPVTLSSGRSAFVYVEAGGQEGS